MKGFGFLSTTLVYKYPTFSRRDSAAKRTAYTSCLSTDRLNWPVSVWLKTSATFTIWTKNTTSMPDRFGGILGTIQMQHVLEQEFGFLNLEHERQAKLYSILNYI